MLTPQAWEHFSKKQTVLIVEDNADMRYYLREVLAGKVNIEEVVNGAEAHTWLSSKKADLIITYMMIPQMGGEGLINSFKGDLKYKQIPFITLTAIA